MSDLKLSTSKENIDDLLKKYKNGMAPEASIEVDGTDLITDKNCAIENIDIELSMNDAGICVFNIVNAYDLKTQKYLYIDDLIKNGKEVTVKMGYDDNKSEVFFGIIETVEMISRRDKGGELEITAFDKSYNMRRAKKTFKWTDKTYTQVVKEIGGKYGLTLDCDDTSTELPLIVQMNKTDFEFIEQLAAEMSYNAFVLGDNLYFKDFSESSMKDCLLSLKGNEHLTKFECKKSSANQVSKVIVNSYDHLKKLEIKSEVSTVKQLNTSDENGASLVDEMDSANCIEEIYCMANDESAAKLIGEMTINKMGEGFMTGSGTSIGIPVIIPGRYIKIENYGETFDQSFCIEKVSHTLGSYGYVTTFSFGDKNGVKKEKLVELEQEKMYGFYLAEVTGMDENNLIKVKLPSRQFEEVLVNIMTTSTGVGAGHVFFPSVGDQVILGYLEGDINHPYIMGSIWDSTNTAPVTVDEDNYTRMIKTPGGNELVFNDESGKEQIQVKSKSGQTIVLDDESSSITISDSSSSNKITIDGDSGAVSLDSEKKITLTVGGVSIEIDGSGGNISLNATNNLEIKSTNITIEAQASLKIKGGAEVGVESSGMLGLKGAMTKIN